MTTTTLPTEPQSTTMDDATVLAELNSIDESMQADGLVCNTEYLWEVALDPQHDNVVGDARILLLSVASLTRKPEYGCRASNKMVVRRAGHIKRLLTLAHTVSWKRIMDVLAQQANT